MDTETIILTAIIIAICSLPFIIMSVSSKKRKTQLLQSLSKIAQQNNCKITKRDLCGNLALGLDENSNALFFFKKGDEKETALYIDLNDIKNCKIIDTRKAQKNKANSFKEIEKLELGFSPIEQNKRDIVLEFYNYNESISLNGELELMKKWLKIINDKLIPRKSKELV